MSRPIRLALAASMLMAALSMSPRADAAAVSPGTAAGDIRELLFNAQLALTSSLPLAREDLARAQAAYADHLAGQIQAAAPEADARARSGFTQAQVAAEHGDAPEFAAARSKIWTAILAGGYTVVGQALRQNDGATAQAWLAVREFRTATRVSRPGSDATTAVDGFVGGRTSQTDALLALRIDLFDTYQARLIETLRDLAEADTNGYPARRAELAGLAEGYFSILAPAYSEQRGPEALIEASQAFEELTSTAAHGQSADSQLTQIDTLLTNFRAAPLGPAEQSRRAGQMLRFLSLIPVEYGRGVIDGKVAHDFEIQEAITFHAGAFAAFSDLQNLLDARSPAATARAKTQFDALSRALAGAGRGTSIASVEAVQSQADGLAATLKSAMPAEWTANAGAQGDFDVIDSMLDQMECAISTGDYTAAESSRLEAYAIMETGPEAWLMVFAPELKLRLEELFWNGQNEYPGLAYLIANHAPLKAIKSSRSQLDSALNEAQTTLGASTSPISTGVNAGMIMFREGLEAIIILASLMGSMKRDTERKYRKPMWIGAGLALGATALTWLLAHDVLQSLARYGEKLEAVVSLIAVAVLLVIMNWFFHKLYWTEWIAGFHARKRQLLSGEAGLLLGLVTLGFTSVYREGFETVLFLQALVLENGVSTVLIGMAGGLAAVVLIGATTFWLQVNLPYKRMLILTGVLVGGVLLQMVGTTAHVMQVVGWVPIHIIEMLPLPYWLGTWFGVYATWEGLLAQLAAAGFVIGTYYIAEAQQKRHRDQAGAGGALRQTSQGTAGGE